MDKKCLQRSFWLCYVQALFPHPYSSTSAARDHRTCPILLQPLTLHLQVTARGELAQQEGGIFLKQFLQDHDNDLTLHKRDANYINKSNYI